MFSLTTDGERKGPCLLNRDHIIQTGQDDSLMYLGTMENGTNLAERRQLKTENLFYTKCTHIIERDPSNNE